MTITAEQIRAARKLLGWSMAKLAKRTQRSVLTVDRAERSAMQAHHVEVTHRAFQYALEAAGVEFTNGEQPGVRMRTLS